MKIVQRQQGVVFLFQRGNTVVLGLGGIFRSVLLFLGFTELLLQINDLLLTGLDLLNSGDGILQLSQRFTVAALMRQQGEEHQHKCRQKQNQDVDDDGLFAGIRRFGRRGHVSSVGSFFKFHA